MLRVDLGYLGGNNEQAPEDRSMTDFKLPETRYAQSGDVSIAHQVMGDGPIDLFWFPASSHTSNSSTSFQDTPLFCGGSRASLGS